MHRRDVLKALATLPLTTALVGRERNQNDENKSRSNSLEIHLDGAFAVVVQENKSNSILAFSPRPKKGGQPHQFYFNGSPTPEKQEKSYHFKLSTEGRQYDSKPEISPGLNDFSFKTERWRVGDSLLTIELPAPKRITFSGHRSPVKFLVDQRRAFMPTNHILEYDLKEGALPKFECSESSVRCNPSPDSFPGVTRLFFEIGPKRALDISQSRDHAVDFFNYILEKSFPDLGEKFKLTPEYSNGQKHVQVPPKAASAVFQYDLQTPFIQEVSYAVDCEFGGPVVTTHTSPLQP